ncbi:MAG: alpha/beta hydrolase [Alphaproteobacteria bacterium]|nr:alpha/beta hydrolase [Alphaproteobacteria bacterium]
MIDPFLEAEYNNTLKVPEAGAIAAAWVRDASAFRAAHDHAEFGVAYGPSERQAMDIFWPGTARTGPLAMFIHGGYWQRLDRSFVSHFAAGLNAHGVAVAMPSYDLCPQVSLADLTGQLRAAARFLHARHGRLDLAIGHSAGGHLAAMLLASLLVPAAMPISGLFDLRPLVHTTVNDGVRFDRAEAWRLSPLALPRPPGRLHALVGGAEGGEYANQSRRLARAWGGAWRVLAGHDHFTIPGDLARPDSAMVEAALRLLG